MNTLEDRLRTGLTAEAEAWRDPSFAIEAHPRSTKRGFTVALVGAAAAVIVLIGGVTLLAPPASEPQAPGAGGGTAPAVTMAVSDSDPAPERGDAVDEGPFEAVPFSGDTWQFYVVEGENPPTTTYKVCYRFDGPGEMNEASGLGPSGCGDWGPDDVQTGDASYLASAGPALVTDIGVVFLIDLTVNPVDSVRFVRDNGDTVDVTPFRMPGSGKQFAVAELPYLEGSVTVEILDESGTVLQTTAAFDLGNLTDAVSLESTPPLSTALTDPPLSVYVSNQSFADPSVDITVAIDGEDVVDGSFDVGSQHSWYEHALELDAGDHALIATSSGGASQEMLVTIEDGKQAFVVITYWGSVEGGDARFDISVTDTPPAFR